MTMSTEIVNPLRSYVQAKQEIADLVREIQRFAVAPNGLSSEDPCQEILVNLAEDRSNLAVVGQFKRGKSSLMNAVIGRDLLPTGLLPLTSALTTLCYGPKARVILRRQGWVLAPEVTIDELADYVTERGNPGNIKGLIEARVELPVEFLRRGLYFIDTPGIGSTRRENTATTYEFLPKADAVIFVTSAEAPLSEAEETFLCDIRQYVHRLFLVVNKTDLLAENDRREVLGYIETELLRALGQDRVHLYPVSARQALAAKLQGGRNALAGTGLPELEDALADFLAADKEQVFLVALMDRVERILQMCEERSIATNGTAPEATRRVAKLRGRWETIHSALTKGAFNLEPSMGEDVELADRAALTRIASTASSSEQVSKRQTIFHYDTCPICYALNQTMFAYFAQLQYALATEETARAAFAQVHGLCCHHTWQLQQMASPQGISEGYTLLAEKTAAELRQLQMRQHVELLDRLGWLLTTQDACPACQHLQEATTTQIPQFLAVVGTPTGQTQYVRSCGLCLPHLRAVLASSPPPEVAGFLLQAQAHLLENTVEDMRNYLLKRAALRRGLQNADEETAWQRVLVQLVGERNARVNG